MYALVFSEDVLGTISDVRYFWVDHWLMTIRTLQPLDR
jgi:hypothetical protein